jgi:hypothetical protein
MPEEQTLWYRLSAEAVAHQLGVDLAKELSAAEAQQWAAAFAAGHALTLEEAVAEALEESFLG